MIETTPQHNRPKVTVIVPVFNAEAHIAKCIDSLANQTLAGVECLLIDDHGGDNSIETAKKKIAETQQNNKEQNSGIDFSFLTTPHNLGAGGARNFGLQHARGEFIAFVDSDDWIEPQTLETLYNAANGNNADICYCNATKEFSNGKQKHLCNPETHSGEFTIQDKQYFLSHFVSYFWTFIYRHSFLSSHNITFPTTNYAEDSFFVSAAVLAAGRVASVGHFFYHYCIHTQSLITTPNPIKHKARMHAFTSLSHFAKRNGLYDTFSEEIDYLLVKKGYLLSVCNYAANTTDTDSTEPARLRAALEQEAPHYRQNFYVKKSAPVRFLLWVIEKMPKLSLKALQMVAKATGRID